ncbi:MAG TPA: Hsp20/alpha crystallin family protein [Vicinamibacterales bacterium]|nr:Hsp20/alpha crystallin family protein [Vicinamibacterales bacterium]
MIELVADPFHQDATDLAEDARRLLSELDREVPGAAAASAECRPALDVLETAAAVQLVMDVPGVPPDSLRVAIRRNTLLIVGAKLAGRVDPAARYHMAERSYGRFARAVRITGAFDPSKAVAAVAQGQLRITLPRVPERRGRVVLLPVQRG